VNERRRKDGRKEGRKAALCIQEYVIILVSKTIMDEP